MHRVNGMKWFRSIVVASSIAVLLGATLTAPAAFAKPARQPRQIATQALASGTCPHRGWNITPIQNPGYYNTVYGMAAITPHDAWAVGYINPSATSTTAQPLAEHFDGAQWTVTSVPIGSAGGASLRGVAARASNDVWAVGDQMGGNSLVEHWNGTQWSLIASPNSGSSLNSLTAAVAVAANDAWAVGYYSYNNNSLDAQLIEHWNGTAWTIVTGPTIALPEFRLLAVAATSSSNVWSVGQGSDSSSGLQQAIVEQWNGMSWATTVLPEVNGQVVRPSGITIAPSGAVWVAGSVDDPTTGTSIPVALYTNGPTWTVAPSAAVGSYGSGFAAIGVSPTGDIWAVGWYFLSNGFSATHALIERWNGTSFTQWNDGTASTQYGSLVAVSVLSRDSAITAGNTGARNATGQTLAESYIGVMPLILCRRAS